MKKHLALAAALSAYALTCQAATEAVPQLAGTVSASSDRTQTGLWLLPTAEGGAWDMQFPIDPGISVIYSGVALDDVYYVTYANAQYGTVIYLEAYAIETGQPLWTNYMFSAEYLPYDLAYNPKDNHIYGLFSNKTSSGMRLATVSYADNATLVNEIAPLEGDWVALACDAEGQLYGIRSEVDRSGAMPVVLSSSLYKLDRLTGEATLIGETGQKPLVTGSATIDPDSGRMFWTVCPDGTDSYLTEVDLSTGKATRLFGFDASRVVVGMYAPTPEAADEAPAAVTDASVVFPDGGLDGTVTFTAPTTRFDGTPSTGQVDYSITIDGNEVASGTTYYGATESVPVSVSERGSYTYLVRLVNDAGLSPKVEVSGFAGFGTPLAPANVVAAKADGKISVSWDAVTATADGGFINPEAVTYTVTRRPDGVAVATALTATEVTLDADDSLPMTAYSFEVVAANNGILSDPALSGNVVVGTPSLPWTENFSSAAAAEFFTIIDANGDGRSWAFNNDCMRVQYNSSKTMDDWMVTPGIILKAGNTYRVAVKARSANPQYPERVEVKWGLAPDAAAMTASIVEATELPGDYLELSGYLTPDADGLCFVGIHGISDADRYYLEVGEISVEAGLSTKAPAAASDLTLTADASGDYKVAGTVKTPALSIGGEKLQSLDKVEVFRGDVLVKSFSAPAPGAGLSFTDTPDKGGMVAYSVVASNAFGSGPAVVAETFVGIPVVKAPASASMSEPEAGTVKVSWEAVTSTADGLEIDPSRVKYNIYDATGYSPVLVAEAVSGTSHTIADVTSDGAQRFVQYAVAALTDGGESERALTAKLPVGPAYVGFAESFPGGKASTVSLFERINYGNWAVVSDNYDVTSQDGDGGFAVMNAYFAGYSGAYYTGKIDLSGLDNPALRFYSYTPDEEQADFNTVAVSVRSSDAESAEYQEVFRKTVVEMGPSQGWHEVVVSLGNYVGKTVSLRIYAETYDRPYTATYIDNLAVVNLEGVDLEFSYLNAPAHVRSGEQFTLKAGLSNKSASAASGHVIDLFADDELVGSYDCEPLDAMQSAEVELPATMHPLSSGSVKYHAVVRHVADSRDDNNVSAPVSVNAVASAVPAPSALTASRNGDEVTLTWSAPELSTIPASAVTDDFEAATPWAHSAPGWVFVDVDNAPVAGFGQAEVPGITPGVTHASFFTFSATGTFEGNRPLAAHSGTQYLAAFCRFDAGLTDDWAISPELSGEEQTISFWASSYDTSGNFLESIMVLYSTGSIAPADFLPTGFTMNPLPNGWARYEVTLPAGARRFAIRSYSIDSFMLKVDDVTFQPLSAHNLTPLGFNIYRDNVKVNDAPLAAPTFTDRVDDPAAHTWVVTSLYEEAESRPSNEAKVGQQGIDAVGASKISVTVLAGRIIVTGAEGELITVSAPDGKLLHNAIGDSLTEVKALPGVYVVKAGTLTVKVLVK